MSLLRMGHAFPACSLFLGELGQDQGGGWGGGGETLTAVELITVVPTVVHAIALLGSGQAHAVVMATELSGRRTLKPPWGKEEGRRKNKKREARSVFFHMCMCVILYYRGHLQ